MSTDKPNGRYRVFEAPAGRFGEPVFPDLSMAKIIRMAFTDRGRLINSPEHPLFLKWAARELKADQLVEYEEVWAADSEFEGGDTGKHYRPVCYTATELRSGRIVKLWRDDLRPAPPFRVDAKTLFVCFGASAECGTHLALGWPLPANVIDLAVEFRNLNNGRIKPIKGAFGLIGALTRYGLPAIAEPVKKYWTNIAMRGPPWTDEEIVGVLKYCLSDTVSAATLFEHMLPAIDIRRAVLRGEFCKASARMEYRGTPIALTVFSYLRDTATWDQIRKELIPPIDAAYGVYIGRTFTERLFEAYLAREGIPWPRHPTGRLDLREKTFREMAKAHPQAAPLRELRHTLAKLRRIELRVGRDGRNRTVLWPCQSKTSRTQPSASKYIFGPSCGCGGKIGAGETRMSLVGSIEIELRPPLDGLSKGEPRRNDERIAVVGGRRIGVRQLRGHRWYVGIGP